MKNATLVNGEVMTDKEWVERFGMGDTLTDFIPTKDDLESLANGLVEDLLTAEWHLRYSVSLRQIDQMRYLANRLERLLDYAPELANGIDGVNERLRLGREKNKKDSAEDERKGLAIPFE
jgi:hypothetical protein